MRSPALAISFGVGFLSLSQEILWVRLVAFGQRGLPHAFSIVLVAVLFGITLGAVAGRALCRREGDLARAAGWALLGAGCVDLAALQLAPQFVIYSPLRLPVLFALIVATAAMKGALFPIVHHLGAAGAGARVGRAVSRIYAGNVLGSTMGPIVTGFWLLDRVGIERAFTIVAALTLALGCLALAAAAPRPRTSWAVPAGLLAAGVLTVAKPPDIVVPVATAWQRRDRVKHVIQNRQGIIHIVADDVGRGGDVTFGGNVFDGRINVDMTVNSNGLDRAYLTALLHPNPRRVLVVGLSTGAWTRAIAGMPGIEAIDVVEINPGYLELIHRYPAVAPLLDDPRVNIHVDDGRRWLRNNPGRRYDLVVSNSSYHWRAYSTQLLSSGFLRELAQHLNPGGIVGINATGSPDVFRTALEVFPFAVRYLSFVYMSDQPIARRPDAERTLRDCRFGPEPAFATALFEEGAVGSRLLHERLESAEEHLANMTLPEAPRVITDLNLLTEYRHGRQPLFGLLAGLLPRWPQPE